MGCSEYDDSSLWKKVDEAQKQLAELSASLTQLEGQIALLTAAKTGGVITDIKENPDGGVTVTYTTADGNTATASVASKADLSDIDVIGTKEENGVLYWTRTGRRFLFPDASRLSPPTRKDIGWSTAAISSTARERR